MKNISFTAVFRIILAFSLDAYTPGDPDSGNRVMIIAALLTAQYFVGLNPLPFDAHAAGNMPLVVSIVCEIPGKIRKHFLYGGDLS